MVTQTGRERRAAAAAQRGRRVRLLEELRVGRLRRRTPGTASSRSATRSRTAIATTRSRTASALYSVVRAPLRRRRCAALRPERRAQPPGAAGCARPRASCTPIRSQANPASELQDERARLRVRPRRALARAAGRATTSRIDWHEQRASRISDHPLAFGIIDNDTWNGATELRLVTEGEALGPRPRASSRAPARVHAPAAEDPREPRREPRRHLRRPGRRGLRTRRSTPPRTSRSTPLLLAGGRRARAARPSARWTIA